MQPPVLVDTHPEHESESGINLRSGARAPTKTSKSYLFSTGLRRRVRILQCQRPEWRWPLQQRLQRHAEGIDAQSPNLLPVARLSGCS